MILSMKKSWKVTIFPIFLQFGLEPSANYLNFGKDVISRTDRMHVLVKIHPVSSFVFKTYWRSFVWTI